MRMQILAITPTAARADSNLIVVASSKPIPEMQVVVVAARREKGPFGDSSNSPPPGVYQTHKLNTHTHILLLSLFRLFHVLFPLTPSPSACRCKGGYSCLLSFLICPSSFSPFLFFFFFSSFSRYAMTYHLV